MARIEEVEVGASRIVVVVPSLRGGGAEQVAAALSRAWAQAGHAVTVVVFDAAGACYEVGGTLRPLDRPARPGALAKALTAFGRVGALADVLRELNPDVVISFMESANFPAILACAATGRLGRLTVSIHTDPARFPGYGRTMIRHLYRLPHRVVAVSRGVATGLAGLGVPADRLVTIPNPVDLAQADAARNMPAPGDRPFVLGVGRLVPLKGFDRLIAAFAEVAPAVDADLLILGEGPERAALEAQVAALGLEGRVRLPGRHPDPFAVMGQAQVFVSASRLEGWGNALVEAMAMGRPVVAFDCPVGPGEILADPAHGVLLPDGDVQALAATLRRLLADPVERERLGASARARAEAFALPAIAVRWLP